jgi:hypothetical protein
MGTTVENLESVFAAQGRKVVGAFCYWSLSNVCVARDEWRETMDKLGLGRAVGRSPRPEAVLSDAVGLAKTGVKGVLMRRLDRYSWAVVEEVRTADDVLTHTHVLTLSVPASGGNMQTLAVVPVVGQAAEDVAKKVAAGFDKIVANVLTADLSTMLTTAMHGSTVRPMLGAISLRDRTGGLYLLPSGSVAQAKALAAAVNVLPGGSRVEVLTLYADQENLAAAAASAKASFTTQLNELREELATFVEDIKASGKEVNDRNTDVRLGRLNSLDARVDMWSDVLGDVRSELAASIAAAKAEVVAAMAL